MKNYWYSIDFPEPICQDANRGIRGKQILAAAFLIGILAVLCWIFHPVAFRGWHFLEKGGIYNGHPIESTDAMADLERLRQRGATHIAFYSDTFWWLDCYPSLMDHLSGTATMLEGNSTFRIYRLNSVER